MTMQSIIRRAGRVAQQLRGFAAQAEVVSAEQSPFLRFGSPFPAQINMNAALAQLPETEVNIIIDFNSPIQSPTFGIPFCPHPNPYLVLIHIFFPRQELSKCLHFAHTL